MDIGRHTRSLLDRWEWEDTFLSLLFVGLMVAGTVILVMTCSAHDVDYYYLHKESNNTICVYAHWTSHPDESAWCTTEPEQALRFLNYANDHLRGAAPKPQRFTIQQLDKPSDKGETQ